MLLFFTTMIHSVNINNIKDNFSLLPHSSIYLDDKNLTLEEIITKKYFKPYIKKSLNIGAQKKIVWVKISLENNSSSNLNKILLFYSPFLEHIHLYDEDNLSKTRIKGQAHHLSSNETLMHYFTLLVPKNSQKTFYIKTYSNYVPLRFSITLNNKENYLRNDHLTQVANLFLIGFIVALMIYSLFISAYIKDKSYLLYSIYLFVLLYDQIRFIGLSQLYYSEAFMSFDLTISISRIYALLIASSFFSIYFLNIKKYPMLYKIYFSLIFIASFAILFLDNTQALGMTLALLLTLFLAIYNLFTGIYVYRQGEKQARLYILGFGVVFVSYLLILADVSGLFVITESYPNAILWATTFEALVLSLAFADKYMLLEKEKASLVKKLLSEAQNREAIIKKEVIDKTFQLEESLSEKKLLLEEVHHRVKNNLHIILSIIQLQENEVETQKEQILLQNLENRINAIAKTHDQLIINDNLQNIDMNQYVKVLSHEIAQSFYNEHQNIILKHNIQAILPLNKAVYVGLIINELVSNAFKYAFETEGKISISLIQNEKSYELVIKDNGKGFEEKNNRTTLGLQLVETLAKEQLHGSIESDTQKQSIYIINFTVD